MKKTKTILLYTTLLMGLTACGPKVTSSISSTTTSPSTNPSTSTPQITDEFYLEEEVVNKTARLKYSRQDRISSDIKKGFSPLMIAAKSLLNSNKDNVTWNQKIEGDILFNPFVSTQRTSFVGPSTYYEEASLFGFGDAFGRQVNAYSKNGDFSFGRSSLRTFDSSLSSTYLLLDEKDLFKADRKTITDQIGIFEEIYDLIPINKFTALDSKISTVVGDKYKVDVELNLDNSLQSLFKRLGLGDISLGDIILNPIKDALKATFMIDDDYRLVSIDYRTNDSIKIVTFNSSVTFDAKTSIPGSQTLEAAFTKPEFQTVTVFDELQSSTAKLLTNGLTKLIINNTLPVKMPITLTFPTATGGTSTVSGLLEFKVRLSLNDIQTMSEMVKKNDFKGIVSVIFEKIIINLNLDLSETGGDLQELLFSFAGERGVVTLISSINPPIITEFTKAQIFELLNMLLPSSDLTPLEQLIASIESTLTPATLDNLLEYSEMMSQQYNQRTNDFLENKTTSITYLDTYYSKDILSNQDLLVTANSIDFSLPEDIETRVSNFLNGNIGDSYTVFNSLLFYILAGAPAIPAQLTTPDQTRIANGSLLSFSLKNKEDGSFDSLHARIKDPKTQGEYDLTLGPTMYHQNEVDFVVGKYFPK